MSNPKRSFLVYFDNYPMLLSLPPDQRGWLFTALMDYAARQGRGEGEPPEVLLERYPPLSPQAQTVFQFMAAAVDRDTQRWLQRRQTALERRQAREGERSSPAFPPASSLRQEQEERERLRRALELAKQTP